MVKKSNPIPIFRPSCTKRELDSVAKVLKSGWWGLGPKTAKFEEQFAEYTGAKHTVGLNSATAALDLSLKALGISGGEIITPALTFVSTALVGLYNNCKVVFADVEEDTLCMDPNDVASKITKDTQAIIVVHYAGHPVDLDKFRFRNPETGKPIPVIEDCAHAAGSYYKGKHVGTFGKCGCFSFHPVKNLGTADGGMITTDGERLYKKLLPLRWCGIDKSTWERSGKKYSWDYVINAVGYKMHMNDVMAAIGLVQLSRLEKMNKRRRRIREFYDQGLSDLEWLRLPVEKEWAKSSWHLYVIRCEKREELMDWLADHQIATTGHYKPLYLYPILENKCNTPITEKEWKKIVVLPMYPDLTNTQVAYIIETIRKFPSA